MGLVELIQGADHGLCGLEEGRKLTGEVEAVSRDVGLLDFCLSEDGATAGVHDLSELFAWRIPLCIVLALEVTAIHTCKLVAATPLLMSKALMLVDLLTDLVGNREHELCSETKISTEALGKVLRRVVGVVDVPLELVAQDNVADAHVQLDDLEQLAVHLLVLTELVHLLAHARDNLTFEYGWQIVLLHKNFCKALQVLVGLTFVPQEQVFESSPFKLKVEFYGDQLQIWLAGLLVTKLLLLV